MAVIACVVTSQGPFAGGRSFGEAGPYEELRGELHYAADPAHPRNAAITDLALAPRDGQGRVHWSADFALLRPADPRRGSGRLLYEVINRGRRGAVRMFNLGPPITDHAAPMDPGDGFLMRRGYTVAWCGWQHDVPRDPGLLHMHPPEALAPDGSPLRGPVMVTLQTSAPSQVQLLSDRMHRPYPAAELDQPEATLWVRDWELGPARRIPRQEWAFARLERGEVVRDAERIHFPAGFIPGKVYQVVYTAIGAPVVGAGLLAARDMVSFLRYAPASAGNPLAGGVRYAYAFGSSQSGRFLRQLLYLDLNTDEAERPVFDGLIPHVAGGRRGEFNQRFGQPSSMARLSVGTLFPFADRTLDDPHTGCRDGLLSRVQARGGPPKVVLLNTSSEYWRGDASLAHTDPLAGGDVEPAPNVRIYHLAGTQHGPGGPPLTDRNEADGSRGQQTFNTVEYRPLVRAALENLDRWVSAGEEPPPSRYPRLDDGTAVPPSAVKAAFAAFPGVGWPARLPGLVQQDFGPEVSHGVAATLPPALGAPYRFLVPAVDSDGNEVSGVRLPDLTVPLGTHTGWNLRHADMGAPELLMDLIGATIPFAPTREARLAAGDPRPAIAERYASKADYLARVERAAQELAAQGYLLAEDVPVVVAHAAARYDAFGGES